MTAKAQAAITKMLFSFEDFILDGARRQLLFRDETVAVSY